MKPTIFVLIACLVISCKPKTADTSDQQLRQANFELQRVNDSLRTVIEKSERSFEGDTIQKIPEKLPIQSTPILPGRHHLTLHWISWDKPGSAMISVAENGWYSIKGSQRGEQGIYLRVEGKIKPVNERELEFDGKIEHNAHSQVDGKPCVRTGTQVFKATGSRKYWRLQNMLSCDSTTTDYVDIFF